MLLLKAKVDDWQTVDRFVEGLHSSPLPQNWHAPAAVQLRGWLHKQGILASVGSEFRDPDDLKQEFYDGSEEDQR